MVQPQASAGASSTSPAGDRARVLEEWPHDVLERAGIQDRVGVAAIEDRVARRVDAGIARVRLAAAVFLVDHAQVRILERAVHATHRFGLDLHAISFGKRRQFELADHRRERVVRGTVIDDDHFEML